MSRRVLRDTEWRRELLRTTLWLVPSIEVVVAVALFVVTYQIDRSAFRGDIGLPGWVNNGSADAARQILTAIAAAVITVVGLVFSITIVTLTLASTQFGPRMLRNFIRDRGTQVTLGTFVATFVYAVLALGSISNGDRGDFVPHLSITFAMALVLVDLGILIYFIHHIATSIQLPEVIAGIARDLTSAIHAEDVVHRGPVSGGREVGPSAAEVVFRMDSSGAAIYAPRSGYLQFIAYDTLIGMAAEAGAVIRLLHRPGHFIVEGLPLATVWPPDAAPSIAHRLEQAHVTGPHRTLAQDLPFAIDQLVEIALRALSPAVNDTFTALTCVDWLSDALCKISAGWSPILVHRDHLGYVRVLAAELRYNRLVERSFDKIRQAGTGMPAVFIRQLEALERVMQHTSSPEQRVVLLDQAAMVLRAGDRSVDEPADRADIRRRYDVVAALAGLGALDEPESGSDERR